MTTSITPAVWYARILGIILTIVGIWGLTTGATQDVTNELMGFDVNLTHNIVHLVTGVLGLLCGFMLLTGARLYALAIGAIYLLLGVWGLFDSDPFGLFGSINGGDNVLHLALGVVGLGAWMRSPITSRERVS